MGALEESCVAELEENVVAVALGSVSELDSAAAAAPDPHRAIEDAVRFLLQGLGEDPEREGLRRTPQRVAKAFVEGTRGYGQKVKDIVQGALFPEAGVHNGVGCAGGSGGLVVVRDIDTFSYCESCLLPFSVQCHVGYVPSGNRVVGLSKLSRVADVFAKRLQNPQRLANDICVALQSSIKPAGVAVALQCWHLPLPENLRCNNKLDSQGWVCIQSSSCSGIFEHEKSSFWCDFVALLKFKGITNMENGSLSCSAFQSWCPLRSSEVSLCNGHGTRNTTNGRISPKSGPTYSGMVCAIGSMVQSIGEDPLRKELVGTPHRYIQWLMRFKRAANGFSLDKVVSQNKNGEIGNDKSAIRSMLHLPFCSQCEHHLLPFYGVVHIGYFEDGDDKGLDQTWLQSLVQFYGCKLQVQERLTRQIAESVYSVSVRGAIVVVEANHICMMSRGIEKVRSSTATIAVMGQFSNDPAAKALFLQGISSTSTFGG